jgi:hypothetical protein
MRSVALLAGALLVTTGIFALATGCGQEASAAWVRQADRLCGEANAGNPKTSFKEIDNYREVRATIRRERTLASNLKRLEVPQGDESAVELLARLLDRQSDELEEAVRIHRRSESGRAYEVFKGHLMRVERLTAAIRQAALSLGARACARPPIPSFYI